MATTHNLGFPRIGAQRELKFACEAYWASKSNAQQLIAAERQLRQRHTQLQLNSGLDWLPVGDASLYDHILDTSFLLGNIPPRFERDANIAPLDQYFRIARGRSQVSEAVATPVFASEMTKWFDTNYHYIVPEFSASTQFKLNPEKLLREIDDARAIGGNLKPVIIGPLTYLWLGKSQQPEYNKLELLDQLIPLYRELLTLLAAQNIQWVQLDEPILALDLPADWLQQFEPTYHRLQVRHINVLLTTYFGPLADNLAVAARLPVAGLHLDAVRGGSDITRVVDLLPTHKVLSLGVIDGRNVWKSHLTELLQWLTPLHDRLGDRLWLAPSCSLLHVPVDLDGEAEIDPEIKNWLAFAVQKLEELQLLKIALNHGQEVIADPLTNNAAAIASRENSPRVHHPETQQRLATLRKLAAPRQTPHRQRKKVQQQALELPVLPTTTIGSFPQTQEIRSLRRAFRRGTLTETQYTAAMQDQIKEAIEVQLQCGLDVLVHGEAERNDMVEYFAEYLAGYAFSSNGWVQSYGSRCVKPPIIFGDVYRPRPITVAWARYAQSLTRKPVKGMLTGPLTMLQWAFVRNDQAREVTAQQIALALRDEVADLEAADIAIIQVDEPAFREGLPLRQKEWQAYLTWAVAAFWITTSGVKDATQIHTHMCYSEFNDIITAIAQLDADVITIETSRSAMELLGAFTDFAYPNDIGPGVYDIHSPNIPTEEQIVGLMQRAIERIPLDQLWVNPDCGLKTRQWPEVRAALQTMVRAAQTLRQQYCVADANENPAHYVVS